ncbi:MAG: hypothetical protein KDC54_13755 [Lewinella sp.]|nr:hypothetical protein [Lewinella sp.]
MTDFLRARFASLLQTETDTPTSIKLRWFLQMTIHLASVSFIHGLTRLRHWLLLLPLLAGSHLLVAQETPDLPADVQQLLSTHQLLFDWPPSGDFRQYHRFASDFQPTDFALWSRTARTEIRFLIQPTDTTNRRRLPWPHLEASRMVTHLADNEENTLIAAHDLVPEAVDRVLAADWAKMYFFPPKDVFAGYDHCRMLCLYREGVATAYVFFLFNEPPDEMDEWLGVLRFEPIVE